MYREKSFTHHNIWSRELENRTSFVICPSEAVNDGSIFKVNRNYGFGISEAPEWKNLCCMLYWSSRPVVPGGARGAMASPDFGRSVKPNSTKGGRLCSPNNTGTPGFSDLPTALSRINN